MKHFYNVLIILTFFSINFNSAQSQELVLTEPTSSSAYILPANVHLSAELQLSPYLQIVNNQTGYRKLKFGYNSTNLYNPKWNVSIGGNNTLEITIRNLGTTTPDWSKIQIRPQGYSSNPVTLAPYVTAAGGVGDSWKTIVIPLSAFNAGVNFTELSFLELPYSASASGFNLGLSKIAFTGGSSPFVWFGDNHVNNIHNGNGGAGELIAHLITPALPPSPIERVTFMANGIEIGTAYTQPYEIDWLAEISNNYLISASLFFQNNSSLTSASTSISVLNEPVSTLSVQLIQPQDGNIYNIPVDIELNAITTGILNAEDAWMHVTNYLTGFRKLKIGYNPSSVYTQPQNVIAGGNNILEITLKDLNENTDWSKVQIRLQGNATAPLNLASYAIAAGGIGSNWKTISIPLSDFNTSINFTNLTLIEFPYSMGISNMNLGIQKIIFTGGSSPFLWFGDTKINNSHNGNGGPGELSATIIPAVTPGPQVRKVDFFSGANLLYSDSIAPYAFNWNNVPVGNNALVAMLTDTENLYSFSDTINIQTVNPNPNTIIVRVVFDSIPSFAEALKASLRYNKDFAYSLTLDDGLIDAYTYAFPLLNGGLVTGNNTVYPGLFYSDGCGNPLPFTAGLSWYSVNSAANDIHINTPSYITWNNLIEMNNVGWDVFNHSYSHAAYGTTIYDYQVSQNVTYVKTKTNIDLKHFVVPSGDQNYILPAYAAGMKTVIGNNSNYRGFPSGYRIDQPVNYDDFKIYKRIMDDSNSDTSNIMLKVNGVAAMSVNGQHYWWNDFTHHVGIQPYASSLKFSTFEYYMSHIAQIYGINGLDNIWMAPIEQVYDYLIVRDRTSINCSLTSNILTIVIDYNNVPNDLKTNAITLNINADKNISDILVTGGSVNSFKGSGNRKIVNLSWGNDNKATLYLGEENEPSSDIEVTYWPNPTDNYINLLFENPAESLLNLKLFDIRGVQLFDQNSFLQKGTVQMGFDLSELSLKQGIYFVKLISDKVRFHTLKIIKID